MQKTFYIISISVIFYLSSLMSFAQQGPVAPTLGSAACYAILTGNENVTNTGITHVTGDVGTNAGSTTGFNPLLVNGTIHPVQDASTNQATMDMIIALNYLNTLTTDETIPNPAAFGNDIVLTPKTYLLAAATTLTGNVFLDAGGNSNAVFVIKVNGALTTGTAAKVVLINGAQSNNIYWRVNGAVSLNTNAVFHGTIISDVGAISLATGDSLYGRAFTTNGAIGATNATVISPKVTCTPFNTNCIEYRSNESGLWSSIEWEENASGNFLTALTPPPTGALVRIRHDVMQDVNYAITNCALIMDDNGLSKLTIEPNFSLSFAGGIDGNAYFNSRPVIVKSTALGTGAIGSMTDASKTYVDNNVTVERFIPGTKRRWNLLTFGVMSGTATIRDAWAGVNSDGTPRKRVEMSSNRALYSPALPYGNPSPSELLKSGLVADEKPDNFPVAAASPFAEPDDYVPGDGTIITGHRHTNASAANNQGYDWWPELNIPAGATWWERSGTPGNYTYRSIVVGSLSTTPSSIRPYRPGTPSAGENSKENRGTAWVSDGTINTGYSGGSLINTSITNAFNQHQAFMLYTRGDRRVLENWFNATTLRPTGQIMKFSRSVPIANPTLPNQKLSVLGNPYPAPIDFDKVYDLPSNQDVVMPYFFVWDSNLFGSTGNGAWRVVYRVADDNWQSTLDLTGPPYGDPIPALVNPQFISSSQGILVEGNGTGGNLIINEDMKANTAQVGILPFEEAGGDEAKPGVLFTNLHTKSASTGNLSAIDGISILLGNGYTPGLTDPLDIRKVNSHTGGVALSINRETDILMVESQPVPTDEVLFPLETRSLSKRSYAFTFHVNNLNAAGREAFLKDKFLNTLTPINLENVTEYGFEGTSDAGSVGPARFEIVFKQSSVLPVTFTDIVAREINDDVKVNWGVATEEKMSHYEVEHSRNGTEFAKAIKVDAKNQSPANYEWLHNQPGTGNHFYRIRAINLEGCSHTTRIVKVTIGHKGNPAFKVFPTIVNQSRNVTVQITAMDKGSYTLQVTDMGGRVISTQKVEHAGGSASLILNLPPALSNGKYNIRLQGKSGSFVESVMQH